MIAELPGTFVISDVKILATPKMDTFRAARMANIITREKGLCVLPCQLIGNCANSQRELAAPPLFRRIAWRCW
jgi:hypothetical protein